MSYRICVRDYESFFGDDFTLTRETTESYVRSPRFEAHGCAFKWPPNPAFWVPRNDLAEYTRSIDWSDVLLIGWHNQFDGLIDSHHYNIKPKMQICAMSMARARLPHSISVSLDAVRTYMGMPAKTTPYNLFKNKRWHELDTHTQAQLASGACDEVESIWALFKYFTKDFPVDELELIDLTVKMFADPVLGADVDMLAAIWEREAQTKESRMKALNIDEKQLQSAEKFAELLRAEGVEPAKKNGKNGDIYAFAKTDEFMKDLLEDDNERIRTLCEARLGAKSTLLQTRAETLGWMARRGPMAVYLRYCGAHTTRWSGGDGCNWQNFRRDSASTDISIRKAIRPPEGYKLVSIDLSQIECRILNWCAGQTDVVDKFRNKEDPYIGIASKAYGFEVTKANEAERGTGKQLELSCGYGAGAATIQKTAAKGTYGPPVQIDLATATRWRDLYRNTHPGVIRYWDVAGHNLGHIAGGSTLDWGVVGIKNYKIWLPNGLYINYEGLEWFIDPESDDRYWRLRTRRGWSKLYGAKLVENITQALARVVIGQAMVRINRLGYRIVNQEHDAVWVLIPDNDAIDTHIKMCVAEMTRQLPWAPDLPLDAEWK